MPKFNSARTWKWLLAIAFLFPFAQLHTTAIATQGRTEAYEPVLIHWVVKFYSESAKGLSAPHAHTFEPPRLAHAVEQHGTEAFVQQAANGNNNRIRGPPDLVT